MKFAPHFSEPFVRRCQFDFPLGLAGCLAAQTPAAPASRKPLDSGCEGGVATPAISYSAVHVDGPFIAMTFDDGPSEKLTPELLDILAQHHIHATFFVIGKNVVEHPEILQRAVREGHEIGNHSWSHPAFGKMRDESVRAELQKTDDAIRAAIGGSPGPDAAALRLDHRATETMDQLLNLVIASFFGTWIRSTGNDRARPS